MGNTFANFFQVFHSALCTLSKKIAKTSKTRYTNQFVIGSLFLINSPLQGEIFGFAKKYLALYRLGIPLEVKNTPALKSK